MRQNARRKTALLQALYDAQWKLPGDVEPSAAWRDLMLRLLEKGRVSEAGEVVSRVTDVYVLIAMRSDRRFDQIVEANAARFDIGAAADRNFTSCRPRPKNRLSSSGSSGR